MSEAIRAVAILHKLSSYGISGQNLALFLLFSVIDDFESSQEYPVNVRVPQGSIPGPTLFLLYTDDLPDVICDIAIYADVTNLYSKCDRSIISI